MDPYELPEGFAELGQTELETELSTIEAAGREELAKGDDADASYMNDLVKFRTDVKTAIVEAESAAALATETAAAELAAREAALDAFGADSDLGNDQGGDSAASLSDEEVEAAKVEAEALAASAAAAAKAQTSNLSSSQRLRSMDNARTEADKAGSVASATQLFSSDSRVGPMDQPTSLESVEAAIAKWHNDGGPHSGSTGRIVFASMRHEYDNAHSMVPSASLGRAEASAVTNDLTMQSLASNRQKDLAAQVTSTASIEAVLASGGPCKPIVPSFDLYEQGAPQNPLQKWLETVGDKNQGGIGYLRTPDPAFLANGIGIGACDNSINKPVVLVQGCPTVEEVCVKPISRRFRFDQLGARVWPQLVAWMMREADKLEEAAVEQYILDAIVTMSGTPIDMRTSPYAALGSTRSFFGDMLPIAHNFRKSRNMNKDAVLDVIVPDGLEDNLKASMIRDHSLGDQFMHAPRVVLQTELLRRMQLNVGFNYYDATQAAWLDSANNTQAVNYADVAFANEISVIVQEPGAVQIVDGGQANYGVILDSTMNANNDFEAFEERWLEVAQPGPAPAHYQMTVNPSGVGPEAV